MAVRKDPYGNFHFRVEIDGISVTNFQEVLLPQACIDVIEYREGSALEPAVRKLFGRVHYGNLVLKRGVEPDGELFRWWEQAVAASPQARRAISIVLLDSERNEVRRWSLSGCFPCAYQGPPLNAEDKSLAVETYEIAVEAMTVPS